MIFLFIENENDQFQGAAREVARKVSGAQLGRRKFLSLVRLLLKSTGLGEYICPPLLRNGGGSRR